MRILVAEDEPSVARLIERVLRREGLDVALVSDGERLLKAWKQLKPAAVLSDIDLPGAIDGIQACLLIRCLDATARLYLMTGGVDSDERAARGGLEIVLRKPFTVQELAAWARNILKSC